MSSSMEYHSDPFISDREATDTRTADIPRNFLADSFRAMVWDLPMFVCALDAEGVVTLWNQECERLTGFSSSEVVGRMTLRELVASEDDSGDRDETHQDGMLRASANGIASTRFRTMTGQPRRIIWLCDEGQWPIPFLGDYKVGVAASDENQAQAAIMNSRRTDRGYSVQLKTLLSLSYELSKESTLDELSRKAVELGRKRLGYERLSMWFMKQGDEPDSMVIVGSFGTDETGQIRDEREAVIPLTPEAVEVLTMRHPITIFEPNAKLYDHHHHYIGDGARLRATIWDGRDVLGFLSADNYPGKIPLREQDRELLRLYALSLGYLCSRIRAEEAWKASQDRFRQLLESLPLVVTSVEAETNRHVFMAGSVQRMLGYPTKYFMECPDFGPSIIHPEDQNRMFEEFTRGLKAGHPFEMEYRMIHGESGEAIWVHQRIVPIFREDGTLLRQDGVTLDITKRKHAEEMASRQQANLAHVSRLGMVGEMAAGLAHELNQPLAAIANYTRACARRIKSGEYESRDLLEDVENAADQAERAGNIIRRLRSFIRKGEQQRNSEVLSDVIQEILALSEPELRRRQIHYRMECEPSLPRINIDRVQVQQVILNLLRNGWEAMEGTGRRELVVRAIRRDASTVAVGVRDTGTGIAEDILDGIFEPFFTTKKEGMGMGLAISRSLVEMHQGEIWAESNPSRGSVVWFTLPAASGRGDPG